MGDKAQDILNPVQVDDNTKALAWDAFHGSKNEDELATKLGSMSLPDSVKADLWDAKRQQGIHTVIGVPQPTQPSSAPSSWGDSIAANTFGDILTGGAKSASQTGRSTLAPNGSPSFLGKWLSSVIPGFTKEGIGQGGIGDNPDPQNPVAPGLQINKQTGYDPLAPTNIPQRVGAGIEQAGELYALGKVIPGGSSLLARMSSGGAQTGADAFLHNQDPKTAALIGAGGGAFSSLLKSLATKTTQAALGSTKDQAMEALENLTGVRPAKLSAQATNESLALTKQMESMVRNSGAQVSTQPALNVIDSEIAKAQAQNVQSTVDKLMELRQQLTTDITTGQPIPQTIDAGKLLDLKRGIGEAVKGWEPAKRVGINPIKRGIYGALDGEIDRAVPGSSELNDRIHTLMGLSTNAAKATSRSSASALIEDLAHGRVLSIPGRLATSRTGLILGSRIAQSGAPSSGMQALALQLANYPQLQQALSDANALPPEEQ